jgi:hypothetical protein
MQQALAQHLEIKGQQSIELRPEALHLSLDQAKLPLGLVQWLTGDVQTAFPLRAATSEAKSVEATSMPSPRV